MPEPTGDDGSRSVGGTPESTRLPLFPLGHVLMPGCPLPLNIFEPRYRRMLADITAPDGGRCFGVVALTTGFEVDTGLDEAVPQFAAVGTVARLLQVDQGSDGMAAVLTGGTVRFRIEHLIDSTKPYLEAEVSYLPDVAGQMPATLPGATTALAVEYRRLLSELVGGPVGDDRPLPDDPVLLSYRLASEAPLSQADTQLLLEDATASARLQHVQRVLRREVVLLRTTRTIAVSPAVLRVALRPN